MRSMASLVRQGAFPPRWLLLGTIVFQVPPVGGQNLPLEHCNPEALQLVHCAGDEDGVDWQQFLESTCKFCPVGFPCKDMPDSEEAVQLASKILDTAANRHLLCAPGLLSAMVVSAQFYLVKNELQGTLAELMDRNISLAPFPFNTMQYSLYANMIPAKLQLCDGERREDYSNVYVPRVHIEDGGRCGMTYDDSQLVRRCRTRLQQLRASRSAAAAAAAVEAVKAASSGDVQLGEAAALSEAVYASKVGNPTANDGIAIGGEEGKRRALFDSIQCPNVGGGISMEPDLAFKLKKYGERAGAPSKQCQSSRGMWRLPMSDIHKCILVSIAHHFGFKPGQLMLDWGSGCGHKLSWAKLLFDVDGVGLDVEGAAVAWAQRHSAGTFCHADGRRLEWLPDGVFDYVFSYAALYHLPKPDQCVAGIQLVSKLRVGGRAYFGWNQDYSMTHWEWRHCLEHPGVVEGIPEDARALARSFRVEVEAIEDGFLFAPSVKEASDNYLYQYPAYSLFITRLA